MLLTASKLSRKGVKGDENERHLAHEDGSGNFQFGLVTGQTDGRIVEGNDGTRYDFTWNGFDEGDCNCGTGWIKMFEDDKAEGEFIIHLGDRSLFWAKRSQ